MFKIADSEGDVLLVKLNVIDRGDIELTSEDPEISNFFFNPEQAKELVGILTGFGTSRPESTVSIEVSEGDTFNDALIELAIKHDKTLKFGYAKGKGEVIENRRIVPAAVKVVNDHSVVIGHDPDRDDIRAYRLDRIKGTVTFA